MGLGYPAGPHIDRLAKIGDHTAFTFPIPKVDGLNVSYSGFKTAVINFLHKNQQKNPNFIEENKADLCASIQHTLIEIIYAKIEMAVQTTGIKEIAIGWSRSQFWFTQQTNPSGKAQLDGTSSALAYTTDNAAMIGIVGYFKYMENAFGSLEQAATARLPI